MWRVGGWGAEEEGLFGARLAVLLSGFIARDTLGDRLPLPPPLPLPLPLPLPISLPLSLLPQR